MPKVRSNFGLIGRERTVSDQLSGVISGVIEAQQLKGANKWPHFLSALPSIPIEYLVVAGGGAGGMTPTQGYGAGGGAGGLLQSSNSSIFGSSTYTVTVGSGGTSANYPGTAPTNGANSSITGLGLSVTSVGGGTGPKTSASDLNGFNGGSGGGGGVSNGIGGKGIYPGSTFIDAPRQGYNGGNATSTMGGAGGGAGAAGGSGSAAAGGVGVSANITGSSVFYAGGGGGGSSGAGGNGGGGSVGGTNNGTVNTGGGGSGSAGAGGVSGSGGSGIVVIRYSDSYANASSTTGSPTLTISGGYRIYTFTGSGSITV